MRGRYKRRRTRRWRTNRYCFRLVLICNGIVADLHPLGRELVKIGFFVFSDARSKPCLDFVSFAGFLIIRQL